MAEIVIYGTSAILGGCFMMYSYMSFRTNKENKQNKIIKELHQKKYMEDEEKKKVFEQKKKQYDENIKIYKNNNSQDFSEISFS
jgi:hypothetical protein